MLCAFHDHTHFPDLHQLATVVKRQTLPGQITIIVQLVWVFRTRTFEFTIGFKLPC